jgi:hypothetical protein
MERLIYPYKLGKVGIPFEELFRLSRNGREEGVVVSGSGRKLAYEIKNTTLSVRDLEFPDRQLSAKVEGGIATFASQTRVTIQSNKNNSLRTRHPDMFAGKFTGIALQYFGDTGININTCKGIWQYWSDNFISFNRVFGQSGDKVKAAKSTWSGQTFIKNGFSEISEKDIKLGSTLADSRCLTAEFHRNPNLKT